jgi:hypothetical protein
MKQNLTTVKKNSQSATWVNASSFLNKLIKWTARALLALDIIIIILYIAGSYKKSSNETQLLLVRICLIVSLLMFISSLYGIFLNLYYLAKEHRLAHLAGIAGYSLIIALGAMLALGAAFIIGAAGGNLE